MRVTILGIVDITDRVLVSGGEDARFSPQSYQPARREIQVADNDGYLGPFTGGILDTTRNGWRNAALDLYDDQGRLVFAGLIDKVRLIESEGSGNVVSIQARAVLGAIVEYPIEENLKIYATVDGEHGKDTGTIALANLSAAIGSIAIVSFSDRLSPAYLVQSQQGTAPTANLTLDRGIESLLSDAAPAIISVPRVGPPTEFLLRAIDAALAFYGLGGNIDRASFQQQIDRENALGLSLWVYVREADDINLGAHVLNIMQATGVFVSEAEDGSIKVFDGPGWDGIEPTVTIDDDRIIGRQLTGDYITDGTVPLYYGYNCLFVDGENVGEVRRALTALDPALRDSGALKSFIPFGAESFGNLAGNKMLYGDAFTAEYYGEKMLAYYSQARRQFEFGCVEVDTEGARLNLRQFQTVRLQTEISGVQINQRARVKSYKLDGGERQNTIQGVKVEIL